MPPDDDEPPAPKHAPPADDDGPVEGDDPSAPPLDPAIVRRFLDSRAALKLAAKALRPIVPREQVEDLAADALLAAVRAKPPRLEVVLPAWLQKIARRVGAAWLKKQGRRKKYEGGMPSQEAGEDAYSGEEIENATELLGSTSDPWVESEEDEMLDPMLEKLVGDNQRDRKVLDTLRGKARDDTTYAAAAAKAGLTEAQLANRVLRFKAKYTPKVRRRRDLFLFLKILGALVAVAVAAVLIWYLLPRPQTIEMTPDPSVVPITPSASASVAPPEPFMPAEPSTPVPENGPPPKEGKPGQRAP